MRKKILFSAAAVAVMGVASFAALTSNNHSRELSDLELANIEALTDDESGPDSGICWDSIKEEQGSKIFYCATCSWIDNSTKSFWASKK